MRKSIKAFSLIEMLLTLGIMSIVMVMASQTLNIVVKVSTITKYKTLTRNEADFAIELMDRLLSNSDVGDVYVYDSTNARFYDSENDTVVVNQEEVANLDSIYSTELLEGTIGNEIHVRPYGYSIWVCIGYFKDLVDPNNKGYLLKRTVSSLSDGHVSCFDPTYSTDPILVLISEEVNVNDFQVSYTRSSTNNNIFYVDTQMEPLYWVAGSSSTIEKSVFKQAIITTQGLTWY